MTDQELIDATAKYVRGKIEDWKESKKIADWQQRYKVTNPIEADIRLSIRGAILAWAKEHGVTANAYLDSVRVYNGTLYNVVVEGSGYRRYDIRGRELVLSISGLGIWNSVGALKGKTPWMNKIIVRGAGGLNVKQAARTDVDYLITGKAYAFVEFAIALEAAINKGREQGWKSE
jgi:hypothetical protein